MHIRRTFQAAIVVLALTTVAIVIVAPRSALSRVEFQPTDIVTPNPIVPGSPLECDVTLTGSPVNVTVYSDPPGVVSYSGTVSSSNPVIEATTSSSASGTVTVYAVTDGSTVVRTNTLVNAGPPGG